MKRSLLALVLLFGCDDPQPLPTTPTREGPRRFIPQDEIERMYVEAIEQGLPSPHFERVEGDRILITWGEDGRSEVNLTNLRQECERSPRSCRVSVETWVQSVTEEPEPLAPESIRMVLMGEQLMRAQGHSALSASRLFAGDLRWHFVQDTPSSIRSLRTEDIEEAGLDPRALEGTALANMRRAFGPLRYEPLPDAPALVYSVDTSSNGYLSDSYDNSRLLLHDAWAPVAGVVRGDLIAATPARDTVLFCGSEEAGGLPLLRYLVEQMVHGEPHPISTQLIRWTPEGWQAVAP